VTRKTIADAFRRTYLQLDARALGLGRIVFATVLLIDLLRRVPWIRELYSNAGVLPNHTVLWRPPVARLFSFMFMSSLPEEAVLWFAVSFFCFFCFLIGWHTRVFHVLSFVMTTSLHNRVLFAENWGGVAIGALMVWTVFLPLGRRFSVDALRASMRARPNETPEDLAAGVPPPDNRPATSLAALGLLVQVAIIYWFNFVHKSGVTWKQGTAVYYVLHQERIVTWLGLWVREHVPFSLTKLMTYGTLAVEAAAPFLVLSPMWWPWTRLLAVVLLAGLHISIAAMTNLGIFSAAMLAFYPFLIDGAVWRLGTRLLVRRRGRARTVFYDVDCGICFFTARVMARMDVLGRMRWLSNRDPAALASSGVDAEMLDRTILVVDSDNPARRWTRSDAFAQIFGALPLGRLWAWPLRVPGLRQMAGAVYDWVARNRTTISAWLGLAACGVPMAKPAATLAIEGGTLEGSHTAHAITEPEPTLFRAWVAHRMSWARELTIALVFVILAAEVSVANPAVPPALRFHRRPEWMVAAVMYPHIFQGWSLFSPEAPLSDETVYVDAVTRDGRHVDPYNEAGSRVATLPVDRVPVRLGHDSFWCDYTLRIPDAAQYHQALLEWILRYPERTGRPNDAIVHFEAFVLWQDSPKPGETEPSNFRKRRFLKWPESLP
jgi:predicted DCC family thiol-disulfide oxidoreductase YuxK